MSKDRTVETGQRLAKEEQKTIYHTKVNEQNFENNTNIETKNNTNDETKNNTNNRTDNNCYDKTQNNSNNENNEQRRIKILKTRREIITPKRYKDYVL